MAIGQVPNSDDLGLDKAGVETDKRLDPDERQLETNVPGVWVIGDVKGGPAFTHVSYDDHLVIYDNLINGKTATSTAASSPTRSTPTPSSAASA